MLLRRRHDALETEVAKVTMRHAQSKKTTRWTDCGMGEMVVASGL
jgi:hypothetical protein